jgi:hypothetical protein
VTNGEGAGFHLHRVGPALRGGRIRFISVDSKRSLVNSGFSNIARPSAVVAHRVHKEGSKAATGKLCNGRRAGFRFAKSRLAGATCANTLKSLFLYGRLPMNGGLQPASEKTGVCCGTASDRMPHARPPPCGPTGHCASLHLSALGNPIGDPTTIIIECEPKAS